MAKVRVATVWLGGCSGCHMSLLDLDEWLVELAPLIEIVYGPLVDLKEYPEDVDVALVEGAIIQRGEHRAPPRRCASARSSLVALGDCAVTGNVPGMRNQFGREPVLGAPTWTADGRPAAGARAEIVQPPASSASCPIHAVGQGRHLHPGLPAASADGSTRALRAARRPACRSSRVPLGTFG